MLSSFTFASSNGTINFGSNLGTLSYTYSQTYYSCSYYLGAPGSGYLIPTNYIVETFSNVVYQNTSIQPNINQSIPGYSDIAGSPGPNAGSQDSCPADTSGSSTYNGTGYTIYYYGGNAYIYVPGYVNPKYQVAGVLYSPPGSKSVATYMNNNLVNSTVTTKKSFATSYQIMTSDLTSGSISPFKGGSIDTSSTVSNSYKQATTTSDTTAVTVQTSTSYSQAVAGPVCDYCGVDHDYDIIEVWLNPVQLFTVIGYGDNRGKSANYVQPNGYGFSTWDAPGMDVYHVFAGELNGDLAVRSSTTAAFARSWASTSNGFTYATGQGPALTATDKLNILKTDPFWNCTYKSAVWAPANCPEPASASFSGSVGTNGTVVTWISGNTFSRLLDQAKIIINGVSYTVSTVNSTTSLTLVSSAGVQSGVAYSAPSRFTQSTNLNFPYAQPSPGGQSTPTGYTWSYTTTNMTGVDVGHEFTVTYGLEQVFGVKLFGVGFQKTVQQQWSTVQTYETNSQITNTNTSTAVISIAGPACNVVSGNCSPVYPPSHAFNPVTCTALSLATAFGQGDNMYVYQDNLFGTFLVEPYGQP